MYGQGTMVTALPATGTGAAITAASSGHTSAAILIIIALAAWTMLAAMRAGGRILPKREV